MGRKPNRLFAEFFHRGDKVPDSSNRYAYTCKACGAHFPRGRQEYLTTHLLKVCNGLSDQDRQRATSELRGSDGMLDWKSSNSNADPNGTKPQEGQQSSSTDMSALETLAEVSRQQLGSSDAVQLQSDGRDKRRKLANSTSADIGPVVENNVFQDLSNNVVDPSASGSAAQPPSAEAMAAAASEAASSMFTAGSEPSAEIMSAVALQTMDPGLESAKPGQSLSFASKSSKSSLLMPRIYPANPGSPFGGFLTDFRLATSTGHGAPRSKFTPKRREQVRNVRKVGACLRCRMLKKPCSSGDPCETCSKVESARLWKNACVRTKLSEEMTVFDQGFHAGLSQERLATALEGRLQETGHTVRFSLHLTEDAPVLELASIQLHQPGAKPPPDMFTTDPVPEPIELLDTRIHDLTDPLDTHIDSLALDTAYRERDPWMRATLMATIAVNKHTHRKFLRTALVLWAATDLLTSQECSTIQRLTLTDRSTRLQRLSATFWSSSQDDTTSASVSESIKLISLQLNVALEELAGKYAKSVATQLEHRVQQRRKDTAYSLETMLGTVVLFNCMEKIADWTYALTATDNTDTITAQDSSNGRSEQCCRLADLITMLLVVRGIPPQTSQSHNGATRSESNETSPFGPDEAMSDLFRMIERDCQNPGWLESPELLERFNTLWVHAVRVTADPEGNESSPMRPQTGNKSSRIYITKLF